MYSLSTISIGALTIQESSETPPGYGFTDGRDSPPGPHQVPVVCHARLFLEMWRKGSMFLGSPIEGPRLDTVGIDPLQYC